VPLDYAHPRGATIGIALIKLPASDPAHRIGSLFVNPGGPGGSGVDVVPAAATALWSPKVRARLDIIGFDPRGVARSAPIRCFKSNPQENRLVGRLPAFPVGRQQTVKFISAFEKFDANCLQRSDHAAHGHRRRRT
jgi:pimeloyl-ACP methyl ester carboxylesterase